VVICLERGADLHMTQLMPLPLTVSCLSKIQIGFTFLTPAHTGSPGQRAVKRVCMCYLNTYLLTSFTGLRQVCSIMQTWSACIRNDLYCVQWGVKLYFNQLMLQHVCHVCIMLDTFLKPVKLATCLSVHLSVCHRGG